MVFEFINGWAPAVTAFTHGTDGVLLRPINHEIGGSKASLLLGLPLIIGTRWADEINAIVPSTANEKFSVDETRISYVL